MLNFGYRFASAVGDILSGILIFVFKIRGKKLPMILSIFQLICITLTFILLLSCPTPQIPGVTTSFSDG